MGVSSAPPAPEGAHRVFGERLPVAETFAELLADTGVSHGLIGPREVDRLWDRHILNCAVIEDAFDRDSVVIDVGSGAGLPGLAVAIARPDVRVHLVEPMQRRTDWLGDAVSTMGLDNVEVHRARAEEVHGHLRAPAVTARAVARLDKLARWCLPLVAPGGRLVAMKGRSAQDEIDDAARALRKLGAVGSRVVEHGAGVLDEPTRTVQVTMRG